MRRHGATDDPPVGSRRYRRIVRQLIAILQWIAEPEELPRLGNIRHSHPRTRESIGWLLAPDRLPETDLPAQRQGSSFLKWLTAPEVLPRTPRFDRVASPPFFRWLIAAECLPRPSQSPSTGPSRSSLGWLFKTESLPRKGNTDSQQEVETHDL